MQNLHFLLHLRIYYSHISVVFVLGNRKPCRCVLLFGASGAGKTYFAKAFATEAVNSKFFRLASCDLLLKCIDEPEKYHICLLFYTSYSNIVQCLDLSDVCLCSHTRINLRSSSSTISTFCIYRSMTTISRRHID